MTVNKGLLSIVNNTPNFSNQALENAVTTLKVGWVLKGSQLDSVIASNSVLTTSQKNDLKDRLEVVSAIPTKELIEGTNDALANLSIRV